MARCARIEGLEVYHKRIDGGTLLSNAEVLCSPCHEATPTYGKPGKVVPDFDEQTKKAALSSARKRCECIRTGGCH